MVIEFEFVCREDVDENDFCAVCQHHVVDLSKLTRAEVEALIVTPGVCVTAHYDADGRLLTRPVRTIAAGLSIFAMLGCETAPTKPVANAPIPAKLAAQELAASKVLSAYVLSDIKKNAEERNCDSPDSDLVAVVHDDPDWDPLNPEIADGFDPLDPKNARDVLDELEMILDKRQNRGKRLRGKIRPISID